MLNFFWDKKNRYFMRLWWAQLISQFGDRIHQMALIGLIAERASSSAMDLAKLLSFTIIPVFIIGPIAGVYADRWNRRQTLMVSDMVRGFLVLLIPWVFMDWQLLVPIYVIVFLVFCCSRFYIPAKMSIIPDIVPKENLLMANSMITTTGMIAFVLGIALGGFIVEYFGAMVGFYVDAATFFISGLLILSINKDFRLHIHKTKIIEKGKEFIRIEKSVWKEMGEGFVYLLKQKDLRFVIGMLFTLLSAAGAIYVVIIVFVQQAFHSVTRDLSILAIVLGLGLFTGVLAYGKWGKDVPWHRTIFRCLVAGGVGIVAFATAVAEYPNLWLGSGLAFLLGFVIGPIFIASNTIVHLVSDDEMRGKVFSALEIVIHFAFLVAMLVSSLLSKYIDLQWILTGVGVIFAGVGLLGFFKYKDAPDLAKRV